ncbi:hypothetical protein TNCV_4408161 [Trichonephila clavipes]|nr:hypothetical protein TNCV_4408161 [Trichonephila clavipes]
MATGSYMTPIYSRSQSEVLGDHHRAKIIGLDYCSCRTCREQAEKGEKETLLNGKVFVLEFVASSQEKLKMAPADNITVIVSECVRVKDAHDYEKMEYGGSAFRVTRDEACLANESDALDIYERMVLRNKGGVMKKCPDVGRADWRLYVPHGPGCVISVLFVRNTQ